MYFRIGDERFKMTSVSRYRRVGRSAQTNQYYLSVWFGQKERMFTFGTEKELDDTVEYLDNVFKVQVV